MILKKALCALRDSITYFIWDANETKPLEFDSRISLIYKRKINDLNNNIKMWRYDNLKIVFRNDKSNLEPIKCVF